MARTLLALGYGYVAAALGRLLAGRGWRIVGTTRDGRPLGDGATALKFDGAATPALIAALAEADAALCSIPPDGQGDPAFNALATALSAGPRPAWIGYLSTTGVYGDLGGRWAFEWSALAPSSETSARRVAAEQCWLQIAPPAHVFRLPGIYGPGRSAFDRLRAGDAQRIVKPGQVFSRAHVEDIAAALAASIARPNPGRIYNICDDEPSAPQDVIAYAAGLAGLVAPPEIAFEAARLSPAAQRFWTDSKRVSNARAKAELGWRPKFASYREGLKDILAKEQDAR